MTINDNPEPLKFITAAFIVFIILYFISVFIDLTRVEEVWPDIEKAPASRYNLYQIVVKTS